MVLHTAQIIVPSALALVLHTAQIIVPSALALVFLTYRLSRKQFPLPPGPPADPVIGHLRSIPPVGQDVFFYKLGKKYVLGKSLVILNSVQAATDLLDKRSHNYSHRPQFPVFELWGIGDLLVVVDYGKEFLMQRKMVQQYFHKEKCQDYRPVQLREARLFVQNLLSTPDHWSDLLFRFTTAIIIDITYGRQVVSIDDPYVKIAEACAGVAAEAGAIGGTPVDLFPFLRYFPSWFPGTYYATLARKAVDKFQRLKEYPFVQVMEQMKQDDEASIKHIKAAAAIVYLAGAETTSSTLCFFVLAMVLHPECQQKAQDEIDAVVGYDRLPEFHDRENLAYLECLLQETLRWFQVLPMGVPHRTMEDDIYNGMLIPKGSTVIANTRAMTLDESVYQDPFTFDPTRYLAAPAGRGEPYPTGPFGFGRRICPGRHFADDTLWIAMATILATISIAKAVGNDGKEIIPDVVPVTVGSTSRPRPFRCRLEARNDAASNLLRNFVVDGVGLMWCHQGKVSQAARSTVTCVHPFSSPFTTAE
ncbi:putative cytochrome p450 [Lyophyllum shimeji]|uniref:Cytochrome p450 n=1 Tax=Lyophyllum shimeji TaxID=47721 RepID=A0A9P3UUK3_LYOSH|nr:putative cytochrome p450 [Lyophyllum shimeji]